MTRAGMDRGFAVSRVIALFMITAVATNVALGFVLLGDRVNSADGTPLAARSLLR
jgi:hypothetical protein